MSDMNVHFDPSSIVELEKKLVDAAREARKEAYMASVSLPDPEERKAFMSVMLEKEAGYEMALKNYILSAVLAKFAASDGEVPSFDDI